MHGNMSRFATKLIAYSLMTWPSCMHYHDYDTPPIYAADASFTSTLSWISESSYRPLVSSLACAVNPSGKPIAAWPSTGQTIVSGLQESSRRPLSSCLPLALCLLAVHSGI